MRSGVCAGACEAALVRGRDSPQLAILCGAIHASSGDQSDPVSVQELVKQRSFAAATAHSWQLRAVQSTTFRAEASAGTGAAAPAVEWARELLDVRPVSPVPDTLKAVSTQPGSFARQLLGLAKSLVLVLDVRFFLGCSSLACCC